MAKNIVDIHVGFTKYHTSEPVSKSAIRAYEDHLLTRYGSFRRYEVTNAYRLSESGVDIRETEAVYQICVDSEDGNQSLIGQLIVDTDVWARRLDQYTLGLAIRPADHIAMRVWESAQSEEERGNSLRTRTRLLRNKRVDIYVGLAEYDTGTPVSEDSIRAYEDHLLGLDWGSMEDRGFGFHRYEVTSAWRLPDGADVREPTAVYQINVALVDYNELISDCAEWAPRLKQLALGVIVQSFDFDSS